MSNFWDYSVWGGVNLIALLLMSLLVANLLKKSIPALQASLIPTSVLGGTILLIVASVYSAITGKQFFETNFFGGYGTEGLEIITYHALALGFIATSFRSSGGKLTKKRRVEILNTGVNTVCVYLMQAAIGLAITIPAAMFVADFFPAAGILLPFGYGQGTGQALNYGSIYESTYGFVGGKSFGLTVAALGFISASIGGVIHLNLLKRKGRITGLASEEGMLHSEQIQNDDEIPMNGSMDKLTVQVALIGLTYWLSYLLILLLGNLIPGLRSVIYGFNFLFGVLMTALLKLIMNTLRRKSIIQKQYVNDFLMNRIGGMFFDLMVVAGIAAIRLDLLKDYWGIILIIGVLGAVVTYFQIRFVCHKLFPDYAEEQFLATYGMLTGTASTGIILLRELDPEFQTPAADNLVYQNFPAMVLGFPIMLIATLAPVQPILSLIIILALFLILTIVLFRRRIFLKEK